MARATLSLPTPVSPLIRTVTLVSAARLTMSSTACIRSLPRKSSSRLWEERSLSATEVETALKAGFPPFWAKPRLIASRSVCGRRGLTRKSQAPARTALTASAESLVLDTATSGASRLSRRICWMRSSAPASVSSRSTRMALGRRLDSKASPSWRLPTARTGWPMSLTVRVRTSRSVRLVPMTSTVSAAMASFERYSLTLFLDEGSPSADTPTAELLMRILVVEDDPSVAQVVADALRLEGHDVLVALDGGEGLSVLETSVVDGVFLDLVMPGLDGLTVLSRIRSRH